ncbi:hypothetical protein PIB30_041235 [Stylosanthes scabra]|uniref:Uncharacterized protein n=1 Tax=Stylosanthes scabra TaxID=79078 RepID=A0ABU6TFT9_9FABA|nr:hypothetical protein [Stylosanthes scabra]
MSVAALDHAGKFLDEIVGKVRFSQDFEGALANGRTRGAFEEFASLDNLNLIHSLDLITSLTARKSRLKSCRIFLSIEARSSCWFKLFWPLKDIPVSHFGYPEFASTLDMIAMFSLPSASRNTAVVAPVPASQ